MTCQPEPVPVGRYRTNEIGSGLAAMWRTDVVSFAKTMQNVLPVDAWIAFDYLAQMLAHIQRRVMEGGARIIISMPPRHGKSESINFWFCLWFSTLFPERKILLASYATSLPTEFTKRVRDVLLEFGPSMFGVDLDKATEAEWTTTAGGGMKAAGVGKGITGKGFDLGIVDDPIADWQEATSPTQLQKKIDWFNSTFYTRRSENASIIVIMTRWAKRDLAGYLQHESESEWEVIKLSAIAGKNDWAGREEGEALCPYRWPLESLQKIKKAIGSPKIWAGLYEQSPKADDGDVFDTDRFQRWTSLPVPDQVIMSWDMTFGSKSKTASYVVGQVWIIADGRYYLIAQVRGKWSFRETLAQVRRMTDAYRNYIDITLIENKAFGGAINDQLNDELINPVLIEPSEYGSKQGRAEAASVAYEAGRALIPSDDAYDWVPGYVEEHDAFPGGANDDQIDAGSQVINYLERRQNLGVWGAYAHRRAA